MIGLSHPDIDVVARITKLIDDHRARGVSLSIRELTKAAPIKPEVIQNYADRLDTHGWTPEQLAAAITLPGTWVILPDPVVIREKFEIERYPAVTGDQMRHRLPVYVSHQYVVYPDQDAHEPGYWDEQVFTTVTRANDLIGAITSVLNERGFVTIADVLTNMYNGRVDPKELVKREWPAPWTKYGSITLGWDRTDHFKVEHPEGSIPLMRRITFPKPKPVVTTDQVKALMDLKGTYKTTGDAIGYVLAKDALNRVYGTAAMQAVPHPVETLEEALRRHHVDERYVVCGPEPFPQYEHEDLLFEDEEAMLEVLWNMTKDIHEYGYVVASQVLNLIRFATMSDESVEDLWENVDTHYCGWTCHTARFVVMRIPGIPGVSGSKLLIRFPTPTPLCIQSQDRDEDEVEFSPNEHVSIVIDKNCTAPAQYIKDILDAVAPGRSVSICFS